VRRAGDPAARGRHPRHGHRRLADVLDDQQVSSDVADALRRLDLHSGETPVALAVSWAGSATFRRIDAFCRGVVDGLREVLARGHPLVLVFDGDVGGLFGIHLRETLALTNPVVSIDGVELTDFNYVDIGELIPSSGAVPVVIKSLVFRGRESRADSRPATRDP
jgi:ethanolamine utilization protein EutA